MPPPARWPARGSCGGPTTWIKPTREDNWRRDSPAPSVPRRVRRFEPNHPDADANGYVTMPDVDPLEETVNMMSAARSFEANTTAFNTAKEMARASLKLGDS